VNVYYLLRCAQAASTLEWGGNLWPAWTAWWTFFTEVCGLEIDERPREILSEYKVMATQCGPYSLHPDFAMVSDRPVFIRRNAAGRLHCSTGPAIEWRDGWNLYFWHGLRIPPSHEWIVTHKERLRFETIALERNAELRRVMFEIALEADPDIVARQARLISEDTLHGQPRRLLEVKVGQDVVRMIEVHNGSLEPDGSRRRFFLGAMPGNTPHECVAASYGRNPARYREAIRT